MSKTPDDWLGAWINQDERVYDDAHEYYAEVLADFDLEKAERIYRKYSRSTIVRAFIGKMKNG